MGSKCPHAGKSPSTSEALRDCNEYKKGSSFAERIKLPGNHMGYTALTIAFGEIS
jgi:hypothetical protein